MRGLLLNYTEKVIALEHRVDEMKPQVEALKRISYSFVCLKGIFYIID
ncbi:MAG: hypothetical protein ACL7BU_08620 [Candidatus Phlomobacter fragariae]